MATLLSHLTGSQWTTDGPQTPTQRFFAEYAATVDSYGFTQGSGSRFYAKDVVFHNQNNAEYHGSSQMYPWMRSLFGQFSRLRHDILNVWELQLPPSSPSPSPSTSSTSSSASSSLLFVQATRNIWTPGHDTSGPPQVKAPMFWVSRIGVEEIGDEGEEGEGEGEGEGKEGEGRGRLRFREVWLYWDTGLLVPWMPGEAVVFRGENVVEERERREAEGKEGEGK